MTAVIVGKYTLYPDCFVKMPKGAELLAVHEQKGKIQLWALIDTDMPEVVRHFKVFGTGHPIENAQFLDFVGTVIFAKGSLVFHVFEGDL